MNTTHTQYLNYEDYISTTAFFGEVKKTIYSKNFLGGRMTNIFGATKLDFTGADINGTAVIDISQAFGEVKIKAPADWHIVTDVSGVFGVVDDKRSTTDQIRNDKMLILTGLSFFANIDIVN